MTLTLKLFASLAERAGSRGLVLEVPEGLRAGDLWEEVLRLRPALARAPRPRVAVNLEFAEDGRVLRPGDEVALIPPVSGG